MLSSPQQPGTDYSRPGDTVLVLDRLSATPVSVSQIRTWTSRDPLRHVFEILYSKDGLNRLTRAFALFILEDLS